MRHILIIAAAGGLGAACGDDGGAAAETRADAVEAEVEVTPEVEVEVTPETSEPGDGDASAPACRPGDMVDVVAGPDEVTLTLCGATLVASAPEGTRVSLGLVEAPTPYPFEHALVGHAYMIGGGDTFGRLTIEDDGALPGYRMAAMHDAGQGWLGFEACPGEDGLELPVGEGTYALFRDINRYPESPQALGSGSITSQFLGASITWSFDDGYAIHDVDAAGLRNVTLISRRTPSEGILQQLDIRLVEQTGGSFAVLQVTLLDTSDLSGGWSWLEPVDGPLAGAALVSDGAGGPVSGTFEAPLRKGEAVEVMAVELDITSERYRFPPEGACFPEG